MKKGESRMLHGEDLRNLHPKTEISDDKMMTSSYYPPVL